jgi:predicted dehydrogenase
MLIDAWLAHRHRAGKWRSCAAMSPHVEAIRVGLIGYGLAGAAFHAPLIATTPGLRLDAIVTAKPERQMAATRDHPGARIVAGAERLFAGDPQVDLAVIASPNRTHVALAAAAIDARIATVVDKPFAATAGEGRTLIAAAKNGGVLLTVFHNRRWDGDFLTVRRLIAEGTLGDVYRFESRFERWRPEPRRTWREDGAPSEAGGLLYDLGSHLIDQALVLLGPATTVYAELDRRRTGVAVDDDSFVALTHASGIRSHLWMSSVAAQAAPRMRILGSRAAYTKYGFDVQEAALRGGARPGPGWGEELPENWGRLGTDDDASAIATEAGNYPEFYRLLERTLRHGGAPPVLAEDAIRSLEVIEAAQKSAATGQAIPLKV